MDTAARLAAAQIARADAKRAFHAAVSDATQAAVRRGLRTIEAVDAAVEADPAVIAARAASEAAIAELKAAEEASTAAERLATVETAARLDATTLGDGSDRAPAAAHTEGSDDVTTVAPVSPAAALWTEILVLTPAQAGAAYDILAADRAAQYGTAATPPCQGPGDRPDVIRAQETERADAAAAHRATELRAHLLSRRAAGGLHTLGCSLCKQVSA